MLALTKVKNFVTNKYVLIGLAVLIVIIVLLKMTGVETFNQIGGAENDSDKTIVLFYAPWCPHCKDVMPAWDKVAKNHQNDNVTVKKVNCESNPKAAEKNEVQAFPTIILFKGNKKVATFDDERTVENIENFINSN